MKRGIIFIFLMHLVIAPGVYCQTYISYFTGSPADKVTNPSGGVCLMGGATENDEAMKWFLNRSSGGDVLVLRTSGSDGYNVYMYSELGVQLNSVETILCKNSLASAEPYIHQKIMQAEAIWFAGGDQTDYISYWRNTVVDSLINDAIIKRHIVVGGTSAGMAIMGGFYYSGKNGSVTSDEALANPYNNKMTIDSASFLKNKYLENVITDTHYDGRTREGRHVAFMARILTDWGVDAKGIAADEYSAVCIDTSGVAHCYGSFPKSSDYLYFIRTNCELQTRVPEKCISGSPLDWNRNASALKVYKVSGTASGQNTLNLKDWRTGSGGTWENWYSDNGKLFKTPGNQPDCNKVGVENSKNRSIIHIYPNPSKSNELNLDFPGIEVSAIAVFDIRGRKRLAINEKIMNHTCLNISALSKGLYIINIESDRGKGVYRIQII